MENKDYIKIGISFDPNHRLIRLNGEIKDVEDYFNLVTYVDCVDGSSARDFEKFLHSKYKDHQIVTNFDGAKTECFCKTIKYLVEEDFNLFRNVVHFDPFITCHPKYYREFLNLNGLTIESLCGLLGKKNPTKFITKKIQLSISCIISNLKTHKDRLIIYNNSDICNLTSGNQFCKIILEKVFDSYGFLDYTKFTLPEDISVRYDTMVGKNLRTVYFKEKVRPLYLISLYSYKENISDYLSRTINEKSTLATYEVVVGGNNCIVRVKGAEL